MSRPLPAGLHALGFRISARDFASRPMPGGALLIVSVEWMTDTEARTFNESHTECICVCWQRTEDDYGSDPCVGFENERAALQLIEEVIAAGTPQPIIDQQDGRFLL